MSNREVMRASATTVRSIQTRLLRRHIHFSPHDARSAQVGDKGGQGADQDGDGVEQDVFMSWLGSIRMSWGSEYCDPAMVMFSGGGGEEDDDVSACVAAAADIEQACCAALQH